MVISILLVSAIFSLWHLPVRLTWLVSGQLDGRTLALSLVMLFLSGWGHLTDRVSYV